MTASSLEQKPPVGDGRRAVVPSSMTSDGPTYGYAAANIAGALLFVSGQLGFDENDALPTDPAEQGGHALRRLGVVLAEAGCDYGDVAELRTYHVGNLAETNEWLLPAKSALFREPYPAWTQVEVASLAVDGAIIEIAAVAKLPV